MSGFELGAIAFLLVVVALVIWNVRGHRRDHQVDSHAVNSFMTDGSSGID